MLLERATCRDELVTRLVCDSRARFLDLLQGDIVPFPSFDVVQGSFEKKAT